MNIHPMNQPFDSPVQPHLEPEKEIFATTVREDIVHKLRETNPQHVQHVQYVCEKIGQLFGQDRLLKQNIMEGCRNYCRNNGIVYSDAMFPFIIESIVTGFSDIKILSYLDIVSRHAAIAEEQEAEEHAQKMDESTIASRVAFRERSFSDDMYDYFFETR
jgi:hypothetical protein